jgi:hypothetical protein
MPGQRSIVSNPASSSALVSPNAKARSPAATAGVIGKVRAWSSTVRASDLTGMLSIKPISDAKSGAPCTWTTERLIPASKAYAPRRTRTSSPSTLESSKIEMVVALIQQAASQSDVVHRESPAHRQTSAEPGCNTSVRNFCGSQAVSLTAAGGSNLPRHALRQRRGLPAARRLPARRSCRPRRNRAAAHRSRADE